MKCINCNHWEENIEIVNEPLLFLAARNPQQDHNYKGRPLEFCPWCGSKLKDDME